jgi:hypothetical protein
MVLCRSHSVESNGPQKGFIWMLIDKLAHDYR